MKKIAIVGCGISGLAAAYHIHQNSPGTEIHMFDRADRPGGVIRTEKLGSTIIEGGPDSMLSQKPAAAKLCRELGLGDELIPSRDAERRTYIYDGENLAPLPDGMMMMVPTRILSFATSSLLTWPGKFEALSDLFSYPVTTDVSVSEFVTSRFGSEVLEKVAEPLLAGIYGGNVDHLSLKSTLPMIWQLQKKGSIIRSIRTMRKTQSSADSQPLFLTLKNGMQSLIDAMIARMPGVQMHCNHPVTLVNHNSDRWTIGEESFDGLIVASSTFFNTSEMRLQRAFQQLQKVKRNSAIIVALQYPNLRKDGFGWLVPRKYRSVLLAATYISNKFPFRDQDGFLVRAFIGGSVASKLLHASDEAIISAARADLKKIAGIDEEPSGQRVFRWGSALPEYHVNHENLIAGVQESVYPIARLAFTGNIFSGVGLSDCISHAQTAASNLLREA